MRKQILINLILLSLFGILNAQQAQWTSDGNTITTNGWVGIGKSPNDLFAISSSLGVGYKTMFSLNEISNNGNNSMGIDWKFADALWNSNGRIEVARQGSSNSFDMIFSTSNLGVLTEKFRIFSNGNVTIKNTISDAKLRLSAGASGGLNAEFYLGTDNRDWRIRSQNTIGGESQYGLGFSYLQPSFEKFDVLFLTKSGSIGIGTSAPAAKLEIFNGDLLINNTLSNNYGTIKSNGNYLDFKGQTDNSNRGYRFYGNTYAEIQLFYNSGNGYAKTINISSNGNTYFNGGNVGIGIPQNESPTTKLDVRGTINACEVKVAISSGCDFVFSPEYKLRSLKDVEEFVNEHKHLPEIAPAKDMESNGVNVSEMQMKLLQKMEEMTLYMIEQNKRIENLENENIELKKKINNNP